MSVRLTDADIDRLVREEKQLPAGLDALLKLKPKRYGHRECECRVVGSDGSEFAVTIRERMADPLVFSVILSYLPPSTNARFCLRRYNGKYHEHTNRLEGVKFYDFHVHRATERYQEAGFDAEAYAEQTDRYGDVRTALDCLLEDCAFRLPADPQHSLF